MLAPEMLVEAEDYYWRMAARKRLLYLEDLGLCTFFLLSEESEIPRFYDRTCWSIPDDHADGTIVYVDKLVTRHFDRDLFRTIERTLTDRHPQWRMAVWYRPRRERDIRYSYYRGGLKWPRRTA